MSMKKLFITTTCAAAATFTFHHVKYGIKRLLSRLQAVDQRSSPRNKCRHSQRHFDICVGKEKTHICLFIV